MAKILLIEDDPIQSEIIRRLLQSAGYVVLVSRKAVEGMETAKREKPALIILDMILPGMHGLEAAIQLLEMPETKNIPIVALSGMTIPKFVEECYRVGIKDFLKKPTEPQHLLKIVEKYAGKPKRQGVVAIISSVSAAYTQLVMHLTRMHLRVESIPSPEGALAPIAQIRPHLVFIEVYAKEKSKTDLIRQIKADKNLAFIPIFLFSSRLAREQLSSLAQEAGADGFLDYPFDYSSLTEIINRSLLSDE